jgi:peptide/nickel transport system permease protein
MGSVGATPRSRRRASPLPEAMAGGLPDVAVPDGDGAGPRGLAPSAWPGQLLAYAVTVAVLVTLTFFLPRAMPGDPLSAMLTEGSPDYLADADVRVAQAAYYGLDQPLVVQFGRYLADLATGDLGVSIRHSRPVADLVLERLPWTLLLIGSSMAVAVALGVVAGVHAGWERDRPVDRGLLALFLGFRSFPVFFLASLAAFVFCARLGWFPLSGEATVFADYGVIRSALDVAYHLALPMLLLAAQFAAGYYLLMRAGMVSELGADYLLMGRAKGVSERRLKYRYAARNALLPVVTRTAMQLGLAVTGAIFVERVFAYRGMGLLTFEAAEARDYPTLQACFLLLSLTVVTVNLAADLLYRRIDPRSGA